MNLVFAGTIPNPNYSSGGAAPAAVTREDYSQLQRAMYAQFRTREHTIAAAARTISTLSDAAHSEAAHAAQDVRVHACVLCMCATRICYACMLCM